MAEYRGSGGAVFEIAVPEPGTQARDEFDLKVKKGELTLVDPLAEKLDEYVAGLGESQIASITRPDTKPYRKPRTQPREE